MDNQFALFLYENEAFTVKDGNILVEEYTAWAGNLAREGKLVYAEKLNDNEKAWFGNETAENSSSTLTGYFVFSASDMSEAQEIASTHPHASYGGGLELRPIDRLP